MRSLGKTARIAGGLYLLITMAGLFTLIYVPGRLVVRGDPAATADRILAAQALYRADIFVGLLSSVVFAFLALALYRLLKEVNEVQAALMVILVLVQIPQSFLNEVNQLAVLALVRGADFLSVFDKPQRDALAMLFLHLNDQGTTLSQAFWGLWLFPLGWLVYRSGFLPRVLGIWLLVNGAAYLVNCFTGLLLPDHLQLVSTITFPALLGEVAFMLWLLVMGVRPKPLARPAPSSP